MSNIKEIKATGSTIYKHLGGQKAVYIFVFALFCLYALILLFPIACLIVNSFKGSLEYLNGNMFYLPEKWLFSNYIEVFDLLVVNDTSFFGMLLNSIWFSLGSTAVSVICSSMTAYCVAKYRFVLQKPLYFIAIFTMIIPIVGALPAQYKLMYDLHIANSPLFLISYTGGFGFNFIILYGFFKSISGTYAEAAKIDGAGNHVVFWRIMMPQAKAPIVSLAIIACIGVWNDYQTPILYLSNFPNLASGLYEYESNMMRLANYPVYFAGVLISTVPILFVFIAFQKTIMNNVVAGGLKG